MEKKCKLIGLLDTKGYESDQRVYGRGGCCNTIKHGNLRTQTIRRYEKDNRDRSDREYRTAEQG